MPNRLAAETSPYLLQHAHNPVDWYPWGDEAFQKARSEDKPVFLSIGYSACHWCHVMERESFESEEIAAILKDLFVSIKVDREERPDIDSIYMQAVQMMTGHGGWPMSVFLTPDGRPFFAGTYFPPEDRHGAPSFRRVLEHVANIYRSRREEVEEASQEVRQAIGPVQLQRAGAVEHDTLDRAALRLVRAFDPVHGGFGSAPKFPPSMTLDFLMQVAWRHENAGTRLAPSGATPREIVSHTLRKMACGGMYDQIGGGFHRYSVDEKWLVPHFEKMLYDNALLARLYVRAWQWTKDPLFARVANEILGFVQREMTSQDGAFYATLDADSEGVEGKFYVWSRREVIDVLGEEEGSIFCRLYDITEHGNWEETNILNLPREPQDVAAELGLSIEALYDIAARGKCKLYGVRSQRVWPSRDEKVLSGWNGWMLAAFADASIAFGRYDDVVRRNADFLLTRIDADGRLLRHAAIPGLLEDYAGAAWGLLLAWEAVRDRRYLDAAQKLVDQILSRFRDGEGGGFFDTPIDHEPLITRPKDLFDNATPAGNSVLAEVLLRLGALLERSDYTSEAEAIVESLIPLGERYSSGFGFLLGAAEWVAGRPREIVLTGEAIEPLLRVVGETYLPHRVIAAGLGAAGLPLVEQRPLDEVRAYVCERSICQEPTADPERLRELLSSKPA